MKTSTFGAMVRLAGLLVFISCACSRAGYEEPLRAPIDEPETCSTNRAIGSACDETCVCNSGLSCSEGRCIKPAAPLDPCTGVTCSGHGVCEASGDGTPACFCAVGYIASGATCVAQGCTATTTVTRCEQGDVRAFDNCGAAVGVVSACASKVCGTAAQGTCTSATSAEGFCCLDSICGDERTTGAEACDTRDGLFCEDYGYGEGTLTCADNCTRVDISQCADACGNGIVENGEECDGTQFSDDRAKGYCDTYCYGANDHGPISCTSSCRTFCNCYT